MIVCGNRNKLAYNVYNLCKQRYESVQPTPEWFVNLASMLFWNGIHVIPNEEEEVKDAVKSMHKSLKQKYIYNWLEKVNNQPKCSVLYKHVKVIFEREYYLTSLPYNLCVAMSRIRTCNHNLPIEIGRHGRNNVPREERICTKCDSGLLGDEFHFILICINPVLLELRENIYHLFIHCPHQ